MYINKTTIHVEILMDTADHHRLLTRSEQSYILLLLNEHWGDDPGILQHELGMTAYNVTQCHGTVHSGYLPASWSAKLGQWGPC